MSSHELFLWGCLGSVLTELIRLYRILSTGAGRSRLQMKLTWPYVLISLVFSVLGGVLTVAWAPESVLKAVWVGASVPLVISALVALAPPIAPEGGGRGSSTSA